MSKTLTVTRLLPVFQSNSRTKVTSELVEAPGSARNVRAYLPKRKAASFWSVFRVKKDQKLVSGALIAINIALVLSYLIGTNSFAAKGYEIKRLQKKILSQKEDGKKLILQEAEINSIVRMQEVASTSGYVPVTSTEFVTYPRFSQR